MAVGERNAAEAAVVDAVLDYFEGWFDSDAGRMARALHPGLEGWKIVNTLWVWT